MEKKSFGFLVIAVAYMVAIFAFSSLPQEALPPPEEYLFGFSVSSTIKHVAEYFVLSLLLFLWLTYTRIGSSSCFFPFILAVIISSVYGVTDELHQAWVPTRYCTVPDMISDFFGSISIAPVAIGRHAFKINRMRDR